jgi:uncharacterized phage-associated protein
MATVHDVAAYILTKLSPITAMKLEKLVYYSQAWSLVWDEKPLFEAEIQAWANGPVVPELYASHRGRFMVSDWPNGNPSALAAEERETVDAVCAHYGTKSAQWLSDLTHLEAPWKDARRGLNPDERGNTVITHAAMAEYYGGVLANAPVLE